jgi:hypothetical protein
MTCLSLYQDDEMKEMYTPVQEQNPYSQSKLFLYISPHASMDLRIGLMDSPRSLKEYSTFGGTSW